MPPKNFLETASSKKKFESYKQGSRRNSTSNLTSNIPNPEGKYIGPAEFPPLEGSSKPQSPQPKSQQQHEIQNEQRPKQQQPQPQPDISNSQNSYSNVVCNQKKRSRKQNLPVENCTSFSQRTFRKQKCPRN